MQSVQQTSKEKLRKLAEERLKTMRSTIEHHNSETDILKVFYELQVYQIELEMQNEELKAAKERAELAEKKYTDLYEFAPSGHITLSKDGDIIEMNFSAAKLLNKDRSDLIDSKLALFFSDETKPDFITFSDLLLNGTNKADCEVKVEYDGAFLAYVNINGIKGRDDKTIELSMVDITKNKQAEESLLQMEIARESLKFKQSFLANMSHEIRTPLTGVLGMIDVLEHTDLNKEQMEYFHTLKLSGENLKIIINQVLDYSKIEAGKLKIKPIIFEFKSLFAEMKTLYRASAKKGVKFSIQCDPEISTFISADKNRIQQILSNLVSNAMKFTKKGSILLSSEKLSIDPASKQILVKISVTDTGIGIPEDLQEKLFIPFSQIDDQDTRNYEGTGLGLSICKELAVLMGGEIGLESEYRKGSTFWFTFPALISDRPKITPATEKKDEPELIKKESQPTKKLRILLVDDKMINQKVIKLILASMGHNITLASNGKEAISIYRAGKFDLVLMDIQMPVMDGITATQLLKKKYKKPPPIVGVSAGAFTGDREKYMALGMDDYLTKPVSKEEFNKMISRFWN